jgi:signal recognition particle receptor subunit beta
MALVNHQTREINAKIVYYGPGLCGKTTNIHMIFHRIAPGQRGKLISLATETDRTLFFDFLPVELGTIKNYKVRFHIYTVPGQVFYNATRKLVLKGADGVIFVADSQAAMLDANLESIANLRDNLHDQGINLSNFPMVIQYNKRDLPDVLPVEKLNAAINPRQVPFYEAVATTGEGVLKTFTAISKQVLQDMQKNPEHHNFTLGDILGTGEKKSLPPTDHKPHMPPQEPSMPGAPMAEAKPEMAALEKAVDAGIKVDLGKPFMEGSQTIILPFDVASRDREDQFQLRVSIDMKAPMAKRLKITVKNYKK